LADGGASTMIILVASLIVSGMASVALLNSWGDMAKLTAEQSDGRLADAETDVSIAGDRANVLYQNTGTDDNMTIYFQNKGSRILDESSVSIFIDGISYTGSATLTLYPNSGVWSTGSMLEAVIEDAAFSYNSGDRITVTIIVQSELSGGHSGSASDTAEVRLVV
jgi:archaellum component FlaG (FlaF/FlaG flagellin family)